MKIRISKNSIRYRLTRSEVEHFAAEGVITEKVYIGEASLTYSLQRSATDELSVIYNNNIIALTVPERIADKWTGTEMVGFNNEEREGLYLLVEKDFVCLDNVEEDQSDNYPNPLSAKLF